MSVNFSGSSAARLTGWALMAAAISVVIQILSGAEYPTVPPVFFILLIPAGLLFFTRWRFASVIAILSAVFLLVGQITSGAYVRLFNPYTLGDTVGLWLMTVSLIIATFAGVITARENYRKKSF